MYKIRAKQEKRKKKKTKTKTKDWIYNMKWRNGSGSYSLSSYHIKLKLLASKLDSHHKSPSVRERERDPTRNWICSQMNLIKYNWRSSNIRVRNEYVKSNWTFANWHLSLFVCLFRYFLFFFLSVCVCVRLLVVTLLINCEEFLLAIPKFVRTFVM